MTIRPNVMRKRMKLARRLANENGGKLPNPWKMIQKGHGGLYRYIQRHPTKFAHFEIEEAVGREQTKSDGQVNFNVSIREEHLTNARRLSRQNHGFLQDTGWLMQHGHTRLASYVKTYPLVFVNLDQTKPKAEKKKRLTKKKSRR